MVLTKEDGCYILNKSQAKIWSRAVPYNSRVLTSLDISKDFIYVHFVRDGSYWHLSKLPRTKWPVIKFVDSSLRLYIASYIIEFVAESDYLQVKKEMAKVL